MMRPAPSGDNRLARLPQWAQEHIRALERRLAAAEASAEAARLATAPDASDTLVYPYDRIPIGLGCGQRVRFQPNGPGDELRQFLDVRVDGLGAYVDVSAGEPFAIELESSNHFRIRFGGTK